MPLRTGYERVMAHRTSGTSDLWANLAKDDGEVVSIKNGVLTIKYNNGESDIIQVGKRHGTWSGKFIPHEVISELKVGDAIKKDQPLSWNKQYFKKDSLYPDQLVFSNATLARVVLWEADTTLEDSSAITPSLAKRLGTQLSEKRVISIDFDHEVRNLVNVGDLVDADDLLCTLYPPLSTSAADRHDEIAQDILEKLANESPRAKRKGRIADIKVMYSGDIEEMSPTLKTLVEHYDGDLYRKCKQLKVHPHSGEVPPNVRIGGTEIGNNVVMIQVMIDYDLSMSGGDKVVFCHQLKSVACEIVEGKLETKSGVKIDAIFGAQSVEARIVRSPHYVGTTNRLLNKIGHDAANVFFRNADVKK